MKLLTRAEELILLAIWRLGEDAYCVPILDQVQAVSRKKWTLGSIYITLHRLEKRHYVESELGTPTAERGGKSKRFYKVTPDGVRALRATHEVEKAMWDGIKGIIYE
jgi:DNA-binding PadR family transcriptional regulator